MGKASLSGKNANSLSDIFSHYLPHWCIHTFGCFICLLQFRLLTKFVNVVS